MDSPRCTLIRTTYGALAIEYAAHLADELTGKPLDRQLLDRFAEETREAGPVCELGCGPGQDLPMWMPGAFLVLAALATLSCASSGTSPPATPADVSGVEAGVRAFATAVARDLTREGPAAWRHHFADVPTFFMAVDGRLVFPDHAAASRAIPDLERTIRHIELEWGPELRVDPLTPALAVVAAPYHEVRIGADGTRVDERGYFTGVVQRRGDVWQFRDAHWSVAIPPSPVP